MAWGPVLYLALILIAGFIFGGKILEQNSDISVGDVIIVI